MDLDRPPRLPSFSLHLCPRPLKTLSQAIGLELTVSVFRYACRARAHRLTKKSLNYACLTEVVRSGGFWMCFLIRLSAIPTHVSTVLFAVCELPVRPVPSRLCFAAMHGARGERGGRG